MKNFYYEPRRFKNGNISIRFSPEEIAEIKVHKYSAIECLICKLDAVDTEIIGEEFCLSSYETGCYAYCWYNDMAYLIRFADIRFLLMEGKTMKLQAFCPDKEQLDSMGIERLTIYPQGIQEGIYEEL